MTTLKTYIVADLGGTNIRIAQSNHGQLHCIESFQCQEFDNISQALTGYFLKHHCTNIILCLAVAAPVKQDQINMTNLAWSFSQTLLKAELDLIELYIINDYLATALAVPHLRDNEKQKIGQGKAQANSPIAVCGPGTGLGVAHLIFINGHRHVLTGEGGHVDFAPNDPLEQDIANLLRRKYSHVSIERILSGRGLVELYKAICQINNIAPEILSPEQISNKAVNDSCAFCRESLNRFCAILGSFSGNLALNLATFGGVYIAGGIVPNFIDFLQESEFRHRFEAKGSYRNYNAAIPSFVVTTAYPGLKGAAIYLQKIQFENN
tara:strand:+ start:41730 stop:42695 length:966 start_codon:yes stop_codon:yes gene_type:complete